MIELLKVVDCMPTQKCSVVLSDPDDPLKTTDQTRRLGLIVCILLVYVCLLLLFNSNAYKDVASSLITPYDDILILQVCRGTAVMLVSPTDGTDEIANPFIQPDGA
ncbi:hypothetical protein L484_000928 [Morus notabilis]|uniref:Uncharacterized protein n=1 Tax=Morus notabilis TaxID=981085 RepID=W9R6F4_9ROSA|nr:hypothetical protein L484_000928 [Morus notabilis]